MLDAFRAYSRPSVGWDHKLVALVVVFGLIGTAAQSGDRPNILLIVSEDNGPELGCYGDRYAQTPALDRLADEGIRFTRAFVTYSVCSPSRASFLTGLYPHQNGQIGLATHQFAMYAESTPNMVSLLRAAGYRTGLIGKLHVNPESAFPFDYRAIRGANFQRKIAAEEYAAAASTFWRQGRGPWFLSVNFPDAHLPFLRQVNGRPEVPLRADQVTPMPWVGVDTPRVRQEVANYYNCLARLDSAVNLLLDQLQQSGQVDNTLVIYFGDHGAQFPRGKGTVYEGGLRVPCIVRWPREVASGQVCDALVSTVDLLPTVLTAAGVPVADNLSGRPLQPLLRGERPVWREYVYALTTGSFPRACYIQHAVRGERFKLISSPRPGTDNLISRTYLDPDHPHFVVSGATIKDQATIGDHVRAAWDRWRTPSRYELYDLASDPNEWNDLADDSKWSDVRDQMVAALQQWQLATRDPFMVPEHVTSYVEEQLANRHLPYRSDQTFRWSYLDRFAAWRGAQ